MPCSQLAFLHVPWFVLGGSMLLRCKIRCVIAPTGFWLLCCSSPSTLFLSLPIALPASPARVRGPQEGPGGGNDGQKEGRVQGGRGESGQQ